MRPTVAKISIPGRGKENFLPSSRSIDMRSFLESFRGNRECKG